MSTILHQSYGFEIDFMCNLNNYEMKVIVIVKMG